MGGPGAREHAGQAGLLSASMPPRVAGAETLFNQMLLNWSFSAWGFLPAATVNGTKEFPGKYQHDKDGQWSLNLNTGHRQR